MRLSRKQFTTEDAVRLLREGGQGNLSPERVEFVRRVLEVCRDEGVLFSRWDDSLARKLYFAVDVEPARAIEEAFSLRVPDADYEGVPFETFGDLLVFYEDQFFVAPDRRSARRDREKAKLANANCATQAAFYLLRRKLRDAGVPYYVARAFGPKALDFRLTEKEMERFVNGLQSEYDLSLWFDRVIGNGTRTGDLMTAFLFAVAFVIATIIAFCTNMVSGSMIWGGLLGFVVWLLCGKAFARVLNRRSHFRFYKLHREDQTLGDVARELVNGVQAPLQTPSS